MSALVLLDSTDSAAVALTECRISGMDAKAEASLLSIGGTVCQSARLFKMILPGSTAFHRRQSGTSLPEFRQKSASAAFFVPHTGRKHNGYNRPAAIGPESRGWLVLPGRHHHFKAGRR